MQIENVLFVRRDVRRVNGRDLVGDTVTLCLFVDNVGSTSLWVSNPNCPAVDLRLGAIPGIFDPGHVRIVEGRIEKPLGRWRPVVGDIRDKDIL